MTIDRILELIFGNFGVIVLLLIILVSGVKRVWVFNSYYIEMQQELRNQIAERDQRLKKITETAESVTVVADRAMQQAERRFRESST